jgi:cytochrome c peroxidase
MPDPFPPPLPLGVAPQLPVPATNPLTREKAALGRHLFFDQRLSVDRKISCASCHIPELAFSDSARLSVGAHGRTGRRNTPTLVNRAYGRSFFWDGRVATLEEQVMRPVFDTVEMALTPDELVKRVRSDRAYRAGFTAAFGNDSITQPQIAQALATFVRTLYSGASPFDRFRFGDTTALSPEAKLGFTVFNRSRCSTCHAGPNFTDERFYATGVSAGGSDLGRFEFTGRPNERGAFKVPTLRDVARTAPYMHDGSIPTLEAVVEFYATSRSSSPIVANLLRNVSFTAEEKIALVAFLKSLSPERIP